jgi:hypothetical protein
MGCVNRSANRSLFPRLACVALLAGCAGSIGTPTPSASDDDTGGGDGDEDNIVDGALVSDGDGGLTGPGDGSIVLDPDGGTHPTGPDVDRTNPRFIDLTLKPKDLDNACTAHLYDQYAILDTRAPPLGKLVMFLPGYTNKPSDWHEHGRALATYGFHVLMPAYNNYWSGVAAAPATPRHGGRPSPEKTFQAPSTPHGRTAPKAEWSP